jgi:hypothetical protein
MIPFRHILSSLMLILVFSGLIPLKAQLGFDLEVKKPKPYEDRVLKAEKTGDKKLKSAKRFFQNLTTHYNYFFNASNKLNEVISRAKMLHKDDYSELLDFYNYSLEITQQDKMQLDSVIYKARTGIVMHDLRNDWIDNLYMLWGASYFFENQLDSAALMFQFINYSFADKEKDGYYRYIGSRMDGNNALSISTQEKTTLPKRLLSTEPSRNDAFIWQIRTLTELKNYTEAGSLIATLKNDPNFPERLHPALEEMQAYWFYKQGFSDSAAFHLVKALDRAENKQEKARWEYLAAQMFERTHHDEMATEYFNKALSHTTDPVLDIYSRLNLVRLNKDGGENFVDKNIDVLIQMARKDRYEEYRDIIYTMAAQMEISRNHFEAAQALLIKASKYNNGNIASRNRAFLQIADLSYEQKKYLQAAGFYDSIKADGMDMELATRVQTRKGSLSKIVLHSNIIAREDSLQHLASLSEEERTALIKKKVRQLRKEKGLTEENTTLNGGRDNSNQARPPDDLFPTQPKGEWYFYNATLKTQGAAQFKQNWGNRPNVDNWRRFSDVSNQLLAKLPDNTRGNNGVLNPETSEETPDFATLQNHIPLTPEALATSNSYIKNSLAELGRAYINDVEDYPAAIATLEELRKRFPDYQKTDEVLFQLYYASEKSGDKARAAQYKKQLTDQFGTSRFNTIVTTGKDPEAASSVSPEATKDYEAIYDLYIEGRFSEADSAKKKADSTYKTNYWQPQLLYIQAVYQVKQQNDSAAKNILQTLIAQNQASPLAGKAKTLIDVLNRRKQIEEELRNLQIERPKEDSIVIKPLPKDTLQTTVVVPLPVRKDSMTATQRTEVTVAPKIPKSVDTAGKRPIIVTKPASSYSFDPGAGHAAMIILNKVDIVFVNETKNAFNRYNKEKYYNQEFTIDIMDLDADQKLVLIDGFKNAVEAIEYVQKVRRLAASEIIPWLKPEKYTFLIMTPANLQVLKEKKDLQEYKKFLDQNLPEKF